MKTRVCLKYFVNYCSFGRWSFQYIVSYLTKFISKDGHSLSYRVDKLLLDEENENKLVNISF